MKNLSILIFLLFISSCASSGGYSAENNSLIKPSKPKVIKKSEKYIKTIESDSNTGSEVLSKPDFIKWIIFSGCFSVLTFEVLRRKNII
jgi:hypothetical protein